MKIAAAHALAELAREDVPDEVNVGLLDGQRLKLRPRPTSFPPPFDPRA